MSTPILTTKLYVPPPQPKVVLRSRLIERLDEGLHHRLTLVSAPAGFGKTTLLGEWVAGCGRPAAWLSLDERDGDPTRFLTYLVAALQTVEVNIGGGVSAALRSPQPPPTEAILMSLINEIATVEKDFALVLDDYHVIEAWAVDDALTFLIEHLPPRMRLVVATREDPNLPLARLRARGQLAELRAADLRFTPSEAAEFLNQTMGLELPAEDIALLETRTEGWIAGLQLAALSMRGRSDTAGFIESFTGSHRFVLDYLVEEVLERQPKRVRSFLLETPILDRLCGPLCEAVTGRKDSRELLVALERSNLFVVPLDDERHWFRYHHLFADVLQARAIEEQPDQVPKLHRRASEWYEQAGLSSDAIRHALAAGNFERAAALIELEARAMLMGRREETFLGWLGELPDEEVRRRPVLGVYYALALVSHDLEAGEARLRDAERLLDGRAPASEMVVVDEEEFRALPGIAAITRAYHAGAIGDVSGSVRHARRALDLLPEGEPLWRGAAASLLGLAYWSSGDLESAYRFIADGMGSLRMAGDPTQSNSGAFILANIRTEQGRLREAARIYEQALQLAADRGEPMPPGIADLHVGMSELRREHGDLEDASRYLQRSKELGEYGGISENRYRWYVARARLEEARGDPDGALDLLDEAERLYIRSPDPYVRPIAALKTRVWIRQGRLAEALGWTRERDLSAHDDLSYLREFEHTTLARVLIARYESDREERSIHEATELLERLLHSAEEGGRMASVIEILVLQALAHEAQGNIPPALAPLERALALGEPEGYVRIFVDEGVPMAQLLSEVAARGITPDYTDRLLAAFDAEERKSRDKSQHPAQSPTEPLSGRELEVLRLIARGLSNREIGARLFLAVITVKGHNRNIFRKLGVRRRTEAVARARELGLL
jgi:LuxR family maltose regulon positive regulatory protein